MKTLHAWIIRKQFGSFVLGWIDENEEFPGMWDMIAEYFTHE